MSSLTEEERLSSLSSERLALRLRLRRPLLSAALKERDLLDLWDRWEVERTEGAGEEGTLLNVCIESGIDMLRPIGAPMGGIPMCGW